jgi:hypothetical protein
VTRSTYGLIAFALLVRRLVCTTVEPLNIALEGYVKFLANKIQSSLLPVIWIYDQDNGSAHQKDNY